MWSLNFGKFRDSEVEPSLFGAKWIILPRKEVLTQKELAAEVDPRKSKIEVVDRLGILRRSPMAELYQ